MVFGTHLKNTKNKENCMNSRSESVDSGVSVPLSKTYKEPSDKSLGTNDLEEDLDFEPDFEDEFNNSCELNQSEHSFSDKSQNKDFSWNNTEEIDSTCSETVDNCSVSNVSVGHQRDMLPVPPINAPDGRQYLPLRYTPSVSGRTTLDSSSEDDSDETENTSDANTRDNSEIDKLHYQSGNEDEENSSSPYSVTQEEEDKLLYSSEEESQENHLLIQTDLVQTCQIGNARITLPTFVTSSNKVAQTNDLKRAAKLNVLELKKKRKKWDLPFKPEHPITRVFLNDIGYVSDNDGDSGTSESSCSASEPPFRSLLVTCNKNKIICEEPGGERTVEDNFKLPLPPPKRPPSRPKRTVSKSPEAGKNLQIQFSHKEIELSPRTESCSSNNSRENRNCSTWDTDDTISIIASTIGDANDDVLDPDCSDETKSSDDSENYRILDERVKNWIKAVKKPVIPTNISNQTIVTNVPILNPPVQLQESRNENVTITPPVSTRGNHRVNFKDVPSVLTGFCYHYYFNDYCFRDKNCNLLHSLHNDKFFHKFKKADPKELFKAYQFSKSFEKFYKEIYPSFIKTFVILKMQNELFSCIKDFLQMEENDATEAIALVVSALVETGLAFHEAIETISFNIGFLEHECLVVLYLVDHCTNDLDTPCTFLADILLDLITRGHEISENWAVIKRITKARGKIKPSIVKRMLIKATSVYPLDKELCLNIYDLFIKNNMTELSQIEDEILAPYRTLAGFHGATTSMNPTSPNTSNSQIRPISVPNVQELLAAHIDNNLIRERERYEREVEGTTIKAKFVHNRNFDKELNFPSRNSNLSRTSSCDSRSRSSGSEERYLMPHIRSPFRSREDLSLRGEMFSPATLSVSGSNFDENSSVDPNIALNFEPPSSVSTEYLSENFIINNMRGEETEVTLMPPKPIFGRPCYRSNYDANKSLHNLLPDCIEHVNINERDVKNLNTIIQKKNGPQFYKLLQRYKSPPTLENFITMTIVNLKSYAHNIYDFLKELVQSFESVNPNYAKDREVKAVIEVIVMNLLFELEKKGLWGQAKNLLQLFSDWDSLVSSKIFYMRRVTHMGRYIFLAKIFAKTKNFHLTYDILQCPSLKLLESPESWPHFNNPQVDLQCRNAVLNEFFTYAHHYYIAGVSDLYRRIYKYGGIYQFDARNLFNPTLTALINECQISALKYFLSDIDIYYKIMDKNILRAFTIIVAQDIPQETMFRLYKLCCEREIYTNFMGNETILIVRNNMLDIELQLILNNYFHKLVENRKLPSSNIKICIKLMDSKPHYPKILQQCVRSIKEINESIKKILKSHFNITPFERVPEQLMTVEIHLEHVIKWLQCNHRWYPIYT